MKFQTILDWLNLVVYIVYMTWKDLKHCCYGYIDYCGQLLNRSIVYGEFVALVNEVNM